jgi:hypothetical protein
MVDPASKRAAAFFDSYGAAFEQQDADAIADQFAYPCHMTSDTGEVELTAIPSHEERRGQVERLLSVYRTMGVRSARILQMTSSDLSPRVAQTLIHWALRDASGSELYDFHALYTLVEVGGVLRIAAIAHDEVPRAQEFMARRTDASLRLGSDAV